MKKEYVAPTIEVIELRTEERIAGSAGTPGNAVNSQCGGDGSNGKGGANKPKTSLVGFKNKHC